MPNDSHNIDFHLYELYLLSSRLGYNKWSIIAFLYSFVYLEWEIHFLFGEFVCEFTPDETSPWSLIFDKLRSTDFSSIYSENESSDSFGIEYFDSE